MDFTLDYEKRTTPLKKVTAEETQEFIKNHVQDIVKFMRPRKDSVMYPFLHPSQVGIDFNGFVLAHKNQFKLAINPQYIVPRKMRKKLSTLAEISFAHTEEGKPKAFQTTRSKEILAIYDDYTSDGTLKRESKILKGDEAIAYAQMADISNAKYISRFS